MRVLKRISEYIIENPAYVPQNWLAYGCLMKTSELTYNVNRRTRDLTRLCRVCGDVSERCRVARLRVAWILLQFHGG